MKTQKFALLFLIILFCSFQAEKKNSIKVALILDTSNSMDGLIDQAKTQLWNIVNELAEAKCDGTTPEIEIALYEYGNDRLPMREGYIRLVTPFTSDLDLISEKLFALKTNGGSEYCGQVISSALKELDWEDYPNDLKLIFIAGNEPFDQGNVDYREVCKTTRDMDITVNTIFCGNFKVGERTYWKDGAYISGGDYMNIDQDQAYTHIRTPFDDEILKLNDSLNKTYLAYGVNKIVLSERQVEQDHNAMNTNKEVAISRVYSKSKSVYNNAHWDLVDASLEDDFDIDKIDENKLPEIMKNMTKEEKKKFIEKKRIEREEIKKKISKLSKDRTQYIDQKRKGESKDMLDNAIIKAVKKQAKAKNYSFSK